MTQANTNKKQKWQFTLGNICTILVGIYIATVLVFSYDVDKNFISQLAFIAMGCGCILYCITHKREYDKSPIFRWLIMVALLSFISIAWAVNRSFSFGKCITVIQLVLLALFVFLIVDTRLKLDIVLNSLIFSGYFMYAYSVLFYGISGIQEMASDEIRLGDAINQENSFGFYSAIVFMLALYRMIYCHQKRFCIFLPVPIIMGLLTGSKKTALLLAILFVAVILFQSKKRLLIRLIGIGTAFAVVVIILYNLGVLDTLLSRTQLMQSGSDESTLERIHYIRFGLEKIKQSPILGYGIESFELLYKNSTGIQVPSHNNYIQLGTSFGIVGIILWYSTYFRFLKMGIKYFYYDRLAPLLVFFVIMTLINDFTTTTLINKMTYVLIAICFSATNIIRKENQLLEKGRYEYE